MSTLCIWHLQYLQSFRNGCLFCIFFLLQNFYSVDAQHANYGKHNLNNHFLHCAHCVIRDLHSFRTSQNCGLFCRFWLLRNLNSAESPHAYYGECSSNHRFRHCAQCVSEIYSVFLVFEIAVFFAHFGIFEISTPVRRIMLTIANIV